MTSMTSNNKISLLSLNINGLRDQSKRLLVFRWLKTLSFSIILLQDVHFSATDLILWNQQWGYPAIWSYYNAILLTNPSMTLSTVPYPYTDRILCASIVHTPNTPPISVGSIYLPANPSQRLQLLQDLQFFPDPDISLLGGDCNLLANPAIDHSPPQMGSSSNQWSLFQAILQQWSLTDLHRHHSSQPGPFTHWQNTPYACVGTRIDYLFTSPNLLPLCEEVQVSYCPYSDHAFLTTAMTLSSTVPHGIGSWKLNTSLLQHSDYCDTIKNIWQNLLQQLLPVPLLWSEAKGIFQAYSIHYANSQRHEHKQIISKMQAEITALQHIASPNETQITLLALWKQSLQEHLSQQAQKIRTWSHVKWFEKGEKSSAYFHRLLAAKRISTAISCLTDKTGTDKSNLESLLNISKQFYQDLYA